MSLSADHTTLNGRWFWGTYEEFGFDVSASREIRDVTVLGTDLDSIQAGSKGVPMKIYGEHFPSDLKRPTSIRYRMWWSTRWYRSARLY